MNVYLFTPEHDLCLADGGAHYMPPQSALQFANDCAGVMRCIYGEKSFCLSTSQLINGGCSLQECSRIVPWGWTAALCQTLLSAGVEERLLPSAEQIAQWRQLQHRATAAQILQWLSRQTGSPYPVCVVTEVQQLYDLQEDYGGMVLKAPWSGSGRGLRWVPPQALPRQDEADDSHLLSWVRKTISRQGCVMVEPWLPVLQDFAMEFYLGSVPQEWQPCGEDAQCGGVSFTGYSLFDSRAGVYDGNLLLPDDEIEARIASYVPVAQLHHIRLLLSHWLSQHLLPFYQGPVGVDMFVHQSGRGPRLRPVCELNLRHTMGMAAHEYLRRHPAAHGKHLAICRDATRVPTYRIEIS